MLEEARADVVHADQKSSLLLAALGVGFGAVLGGQLEAGWDSSVLSVPGQIVWWIGVVAAITAVALAALAIWPRYALTDQPEFGVTYWGHAAAFENPGALRDALKKQEITSLDRTTHQLFMLSRLVLRKYRYVRTSLILGGSAGLLLGAATILIR